MATVGYIFLAREKEQRFPFAEQQWAIESFAHARGMAVDEIFLESDESIAAPFGERSEGAKILSGLRQGDAILVMQAESVLASAEAAQALVQQLRDLGVSLFCVDLDEDIVLKAERKLMVSEGGAELVQKILAALTVCERYRSRPADTTSAPLEARADEPRYTGGPVPFGYQVDQRGYLVPDDGQQRILQEIRKMRDERVSFRKIAKRLAEECDVHLSAEGIRKILKRQQTVSREN